MKTLVYNNYNKFIAATDTIKKVRLALYHTVLTSSNVDENDGWFDGSRDFQASWYYGYHVLKGRGDSQRDGWKQTKDPRIKRGAQYVKKGSIVCIIKSETNLPYQLNVIFELPSKLKKCLKKSQYELAVQHYVHTSKLMTSHGQTSMFRSIETENKVIVANLATKIKQLLTKDDVTSSKLYCIS